MSSGADGLPLVEVRRFSASLSSTTVMCIRRVGLVELLREKTVRLMEKRWEG
jgi:hypothetical protein